MTLPTFEELMALKELNLDTASGHLPYIGLMIDYASDREIERERQAGADKALGWIDDLKVDELPVDEQIDLLYFRANAWAVKAPRNSDGEAAWEWNHRSYERQMFYLREAASHPDFPAIDLQRQCEILTNLANVLSRVGRVVESLEVKDRALALDPEFVMARGNRGQGYIDYARLLAGAKPWDRFTWAGYLDLQLAVALAETSRAHHPAAVQGYIRQILELEAQFSQEWLTQEFEVVDYSLGRSAKERSYRRWALAHRLFLSYLNDLGPFSAAASDELLLPAIRSAVTPAGQPAVFGIFNQLKQEYTAGRFMLYEASLRASRHMSDRDVVLSETLDFTVSDYATEQLKLAFRSLYSLFDKMAHFLNNYFELGIDDKEVSFQRLWWEKVPTGSRAGVLRSQFQDAQNWPLRGLFWLSKDFFDETLREATEPDARNLKELRDNLEHRIVKVVEDWAYLKRDEGAGEVFVIPRDELEMKTLRLAKIARSALIYLTCAVTRNERSKPKLEGLTMPMMVGLKTNGANRAVSENGKTRRRS